MLISILKSVIESSTKLSSSFFSFKFFNQFSCATIQGAHEKILMEHHRTSDTLKTMTADNKVLVSQHQGALQRERDQWNNRMAEQERELERYRHEIAQEVAREKEKQHHMENER